jgi:hypothetical protein
MIALAAAEAMDRAFRVIMPQRAQKNWERKKILSASRPRKSAQSALRVKGLKFGSPPMGHALWRRRRWSKNSCAADALRDDNLSSPGVQLPRLAIKLPRGASAVPRQQTCASEGFHFRLVPPTDVILPRR